MIPRPCIISPIDWTIMRISVYIIANQNIRIHKPSPPRIIIAKQGMRSVDNSMHRKSRRLLKNIVILPVENPSHHADNAKKCGAQKIADTLCTRMLGKSPVCQNSGVGKKGEMLESCQHHQQRGKKQISNRRQKILSSRCSSHVWQDARENISQKELLVWGLSPVGVEPTTDCLGERTPLSQSYPLVCREMPI